MKNFILLNQFRGAANPPPCLNRSGTALRAIPPLLELEPHPLARIAFILILRWLELGSRGIKPSRSRWVKEAITQLLIIQGVFITPYLNFVNSYSVEGFNGPLSCQHQGSRNWDVLNSWVLVEYSGISETDLITRLWVFTRTPNYGDHPNNE